MAAEPWDALAGPAPDATAEVVPNGFPDEGTASVEAVPVFVATVDLDPSEEATAEPDAESVRLEGPPLLL